MPMRLRLDPGQRPADQPRQRTQAQRLRLRGCRHDRHGGRVVLTARVSGGHRGVRACARHDRLESGQALDRGARAGCSSRVIDERVALALRDRDRRWSRRRTGPPPSRRRPARATARPTRPAPAREMPYSRPTFSAVSIIPPVDRVSAVRRSCVRGCARRSSSDRRSAGVPAHVRHVVLGLAHALRATGQHEVGPAGRDLHAGVQHRLETRAAASVDLQAGHRDVEARVQRRDAADRGAPRRWRTPDRRSRRRCRPDVMPVRSTSPLTTVDARVGHGHVLEHAAVTADRRAHRLADDGFRHALVAPMVRRSTLRRRWRWSAP